ncbi:SDR family oxidoreductase [Gloeobacter kilaueensis]|uniref:NmrA family protein n=1 Tax=Gloeobacter kilaueensis (strain ATCC BAA-2537 / CCAP 1431/1 / ULC 316 / JS1) TaxID=1183438 RepID=U5QQ22_GLOK1|nr:SDR family oxidoreductase [Gloeobacter kilaueensis]AGY59729.1 NmrA family protein [Gloeobacter kilaueensis JS1]
MYGVTGASGQLGRLVLKALLETVAPDRLVALVRDPDKLADVAARGVAVRHFDYDHLAEPTAVLAGIDRLLLISSSEIGRRLPQHQAVIDAAVAAHVGFIAYTSILHADSNPMLLAEEHRATEAALKASGLAHALLRNGWYTENYLGQVQVVVEHGELIGSAGEGRISAAARADYAVAASAVLIGAPETRIYELVGDRAFTLTQLAAAIAGASGKPVVYRNLPEAAYREMLESTGLPAPIANALADSDVKAAEGVLFDDSGVLSALIGRATTPMEESVKFALRA